MFFFVFVNHYKQFKTTFIVKNMNKMKICALLPIKHNSVRVPGKNYRNFNGKPLFTIILDTLLECNIFDQIVIDTNSDIVKNIVMEQYVPTHKNILIYDRPNH